MSAAVDDSGRLIDPEAEVRKLQELVSKLTEERNLYLRNKEQNEQGSAELTNHILPNQNKDFQVVRPKTFSSKSKTYDRTKEIQQGLSDLSLDDVELLDVTSLENLEEEDSWLYASPKKPSPTQQSVSPEKWIREEFDRPELECAKRSLIYKLDELSRSSVSRSASSGTLGSPLSPVSSSIASAPYHDLSLPQPASASGAVPHIRQPLLGLGGSRVDTSTFTRPKKRAPGKTDNAAAPSPPDSLERINNNEDLALPRGHSDLPRGHTDRYTDQPRGRARPDDLGRAATFCVDENANGGASSGSQESIGSGHKLADVTDVQVVARMQEESLRQSFHSPRKSISEESESSDVPTALSSSLTRSREGLLDSPDYGSSPQGASRFSPGRFDSEMYQNTKRSNQSLASLSSNSTSSPPGSPYGSQYLSHKQQAATSSDGHRRSLPNLARGAPLSLKSPGSVSTNGTDSQRQRQTPSPQSRLMAPAGKTRPRQLKTPSSRSPSRTLSPGGSPQRTLSPQPRPLGQTRSMTAPGAMSPQRRLSPQRNGSPRTASPQRNGSLPGRTASPQRSGIPGPKTAIPRPGSNSKLPGPRRSSIPSMRKTLATPRSNDESWKDGCY